MCVYVLTEDQDRGVTPGEYGTQGLEPGGIEKLTLLPLPQGSRPVTASDSTVSSSWLVRRHHSTSTIGGAPSQTS